MGHRLVAREVRRVFVLAALLALPPCGFAAAQGSRLHRGGHRSLYGP